MPYSTNKVLAVYSADAVSFAAQSMHTYIL